MSRETDIVRLFASNPGTAKAARQLCAAIQRYDLSREVMFLALMANKSPAPASLENAGIEAVVDEFIAAERSALWKKMTPPKKGEPAVTRSAARARAFAAFRRSFADIAPEAEESELPASFDERVVRALAIAVARMADLEQLASKVEKRADDIERRQSR